MNWSKMTDRQRDALVAETMGWQWYTMDDRNILTDSDFSYVESPYKKGKHAAMDDLGGAGVCRAVPHFTIDIAAAWKAVEQVKEHHFTLEYFADDSQWHARTGTDDSFAYVADTAPEAICLAALRAKGVDI